MPETASSLEGDVTAEVQETAAGGRSRPRLGEWVVVGVALSYAFLLLFAPLVALARGEERLRRRVRARGDGLAESGLGAAQDEPVGSGRG